MHIRLSTTQPGYLPLRRSVLQVRAILLALVLLSGCAQIGPYRTTSSFCEQRITNDRSTDTACAETVMYQVSDGDNQAKVYVVEFDDLGYTKVPNLYKRVIADLSEVHKETGALMVMFAHGWKHNADHFDSNLVAFENMLLQLDKGDNLVCANATCHRRQTVGVFLSWRGLSASVEPFKALSFWNRKDRAHAVGASGAARLVADLDVISDRSKPCAPGTSGDDCRIQDINRFIIVGHSFGGAIVYSATQQRLLADQARPNFQGTISRNIADLIVLINPAFEAALYRPIHERAQETVFPEGKPPVLTIFSSEADKANKNLFKIGRFFSTAFTNYNPDFEEQRDVDRHSVGHYDPYVTHTLIPHTTDAEAATAYEKNLTATNESWDEFQNGDTQAWNTGGVSLTREPHMHTAGQFANPYFVVRVSPELIPGHNEIWDPVFMNFIYSMVTADNASYLRGGK